MPSKLYTEVTKSLIFLAIPLIASGLVEFSSGFTATLMLGHVNPHVLAAGTLTNNIFSTLLVLLWGCFTAISVLVAQKFGAQEKKSIVKIVQSSFLLTFIVTPFAVALLWVIPPLLSYLKQDPQLIPLATQGLHAFSWGIFPDLVCMVLLQFAVGLGHSRVNLLFSLIWAPCNILFSALFIFGWWHFPKLGVAGLGWGFSITVWILFFVLLIYFCYARAYQEYWRQIFNGRWSARYIKSIFTVGIPMGGTYTIDLSYLLLFALMMGVFGVNSLAAHQIVMQFFWQTSVISFAVGQAMTVKVGHYVGAKTPKFILPTTFVGIVFMALISLVVAIFYWWMPEKLALMDFGKHVNLTVIYYAVHFFALAGFVQILGAGWIGLLATLRGLGETRILMILSAIAEYCIGLPLAYELAFHWHLRGEGLWIAMIIDSIAFIVITSCWFQLRIRKQYYLQNNIVKT